MHVYVIIHTQTHMSVSFISICPFQRAIPSTRSHIDGNRLIIYDTQPSDADDYICEATIRGQKFAKTANLIVELGKLQVVFALFSHYKRTFPENTKNGLIICNWF